MTGMTNPLAQSDFLTGSHLLGRQYLLSYMRGDDRKLPRINYGKPKVILPDKKTVREYARVTKFIDCIDDPYHINQWKLRMAIDGVSRQPSMVYQIAAARDDREAMNKLAKKALELAHQSEKADVGTATHRLTEKIDLGLEVPEVPEPYRKDLDAYRLLKDKRQLRYDYVEAFVINDELRIGGTGDRLGYVDGGQTLEVIDAKSGLSTVKYGLREVKRQLAAYAHSQLYDCRCVEFDEHYSTVVSGVPIRTEIEINTKRAWVLFLPPQTGRAELIELDIADAWEEVLLAQQVRKARSSPVNSRTVEVVDLGAPAVKIEQTGPAEYHVDPILQGIHKAKTLERLQLHYEVNRLAPDWRAEHLEAVKVRYRELAAVA